MYRSAVALTRKSTMTNDMETVIAEFTWDKDGNRIEQDTVIRPYLYFPDGVNGNPKTKSMFGENLTKKEFNTSYERSKWIESHKNIPLYECQNPVKQYLLDKYCGQERDPDFVKFPFRVFYIDIEVEIKDEFPEAEHADYPVNVISLYDSLTDTLHVWVYNKNMSRYFSEAKKKEIVDEVGKYHEGHGTEFHLFQVEKDLLLDFVKFWEANCPDIVTGWNIDRFDVMYIVNRIRNVISDTYHNRLSPVNGRCKTPVYTIMEKPQKGVINSNPKEIYRIRGVNICDYIGLYKKFEGTSRQSFKLDYIANYELGVGKFDYYDIGYETMREFMEKDFETFVQYNMIDTTLVKMLDVKLKLITLMRKVCNIGLVEYESIFQSIPYIVGGLTIQARHTGVKLLTDPNKDDAHKNISDTFEGAFVYPTIPGYYKKGIVSLDFNSLYPNTIITLNISADTKVGKVIDKDPLAEENVTIKKTDGNTTRIPKAQFEKLLDQKCTLSPNGILFLKSSIRRGIVPTFLRDLYSERVETKNRMKKYIKEADKIQKEIDDLEKQLKAGK